MQIYKPPPPYPISNSTPDLARTCPLGYIQNPVSVYLIYFIVFLTNRVVYIIIQVSGSSPDLLSSRVHHFHVVPNRYNAPHMLTNSNTHRTYTNLNALVESRQVCVISQRRFWLSDYVSSLYSITEFGRVSKWF